MKRWPIVLTILLLAVLAMKPAGLSAQEEEPSLIHENLISGSPFALLVGGFNAEYENTLSSKLTTGIAAGWMDFDDDYTGVAGLLRYYPQQGAFRGFFLGGRAGLYRKEYRKNDSDKSSSGFGIGLDVGYGWLLGPSQAFFIGLGTGVTHLVTGESGTFPVASVLNVGIAF